MASLARSLEKDTETREKDAEPDKKIKQKLTPQIHYTPPPPSPILWRNVSIPTRETTEVTKINFVQLLVKQSIKVM